MIIKEILIGKHCITLEQHDGTNDTFYIVTLDGKSLYPLTNFTLALHFFDVLSKDCRIPSN